MLAILVILLLLNVLAFAVRSSAAPVRHDRHWYHYAWQEWLPAKWQRIANCETHLNWRWDSGRYVSAFGIYRDAYRTDAHYAGGPSWDEARARGRYPTPRQQYQAALAHYALHGGFSGWGCRGA